VSVASVSDVCWSCSTLVCSNGSNVRSDSISSSNSSMRSGASAANGNTSKMSPRTLSSPGFSTSGWRS